MALSRATIRMKVFTYTIFFASLLFFPLGSACGGQALLAPIMDFFNHATLVVIVDVKQVTKVEVSTGDDQATDVYVAEAEVLRTLKTDLWPTPKKRRIAIIGSTVPGSSAVWQPIEIKQYLAFLNREQGHYRYEERYAMRPIDSEGKIEWIEMDGEGNFKHDNIDVGEAIKRIQRKQDVK